ncbi:SAM-dependent chlorinase/fluorinase [Aquisalimonas lutea]|uniref:SAM hydrolase/SAM-dependent halogenase family protein n=1 Tax=Aquisalimonas lutea TaxID=1327750 RepID=UPI0025B4A77A|nr:SAM-dependent chlorinase/fluorinase [Aquisalimonas lutea]MDN3518766.1 SAM-dependent chlorinase/fluorinase [Aquisalimonas lutea]
MFALFTDFGWQGPYVGQLKAALWARAPGVPVVDLLHDAPAMDPRAAGYLLEPFARPLPPETINVAVIDPGVGTERPGCALYADERWYVGPVNGLFEFVARRAGEWAAWELAPPPADAAPTFHGRDVFAPAAAALWQGDRSWLGQRLDDRPGAEWPDDVPRILYLDSYGNAMTGIRGSAVSDDAVIEAGDRRLGRATTFADNEPGVPFWYRNSSGLVEVAVNGGSAAGQLHLVPGSRVRLIRP